MGIKDFYYKKTATFHNCYAHIIIIFAIYFTQLTYFINNAHNNRTFCQ